VTFKCRGFVALPGTPGSSTASHLTDAVLISQMSLLLASDLTALLILRAAFFFIRSLCSVLRRDLKAFSPILCFVFVSAQLKRFSEQPKLGAWSFLQPMAQQMGENSQQELQLGRTVLYGVSLLSVDGTSCAHSPILASLVSSSL